MNQNLWSEKDEVAYQEKLRQHEAEMPQTSKFDPVVFGKREETRKKFFSSLTPAERLRYQSEQEPIIL